MRFWPDFSASPGRHPLRRPLAGCWVAIGLALSIVLIFLQSIALGAAADRSIRTPTSKTAASTVQCIDQAEKRRLVWVVSQNTQDQAARLSYQLARDGDHGIDECFELQT